jgi:hypothetical protein
MALHGNHRRLNIISIPSGRDRSLANPDRPGPPPALFACGTGTSGGVRPLMPCSVSTDRHQRGRRLR